MRVIVGRDLSHDHFGSTVGGRDHGMAYALGFAQLGHEVYVMEDVAPKQCVDAHGRPVEFDQWPGRDRFEQILERYGLWPSGCLIYDGGRATHGMEFDDAVACAASADLLVNLQGRLKTHAVLRGPSCRAYVDINPGKTQVYHDVYGIDRGFADHDAFFSVGLNIGTARSPIPDCGLDWLPLFPPVALSLWEPFRFPVSSDTPFTTISSWSGKNTFEFQGRLSGEKVDQWRRFIDVPRQARQPLQLAVPRERVGDDEAETFRSHGWLLTSAAELADLDSYRDYIARSRGEFSIANHRYVQFETGWLSDRTVRYLASGRPAVVQATGLDDHVPVGLGIVTFTTPEEAVAGLGRVNDDYESHAQAARDLAERLFASEVVVESMLTRLGL